jgi:hypothetical protein
MLVPKSSKIFSCFFCDYNTSRKSQWDRHVSTLKHKNQRLSTVCQPKSSKFVCEKCEKNYKDRSGLWRHKSKCTGKVENNEGENSQKKSENFTTYVDKYKIPDNEIIDSLMKKNDELMKMLKEQQDTMKEIVPRIGNTIISHNKYNLNIFLNEECKDALNLSEFIKSLNISLAEIETTTRIGYVEGVSNIFINGLKQLEVNQRPIHCSDAKRETLYVKDNNEWNKENSKEKIKHAIEIIDKKQIDMMKEWEANNPTWKNSEKGTMEYMKMVHTITSGSDLSENNSHNKIIKNVVKEVIL